MWGRRLLVAAAALCLWAAVIAVTGGVRLEAGPFRLSSRNAARVGWLAAVLAAAAWHLAYRGALTAATRRVPSLYAQLEARLRAATPWVARLAAIPAWAAATAVFITGLRHGSRVAGGADAFGYLSESVLYVGGALGIDQSFAGALPWPHATGSFVPLAYHLGANGIMGPTVAPGLPLLMAAARLAAECAPYLVVPLCGALLVAATFHLGRRLTSAGPALVAALLVACSPVVLFESLVVMADVPAAAFWIAALAVALRSTSGSAAGAGALSGVAILIRPNLLPLAIFPWLLSVCRTRDVKEALARTALFAATSAPAAVAVAWINQRVYGSPLSSGYGDLGGAFSMNHASANLKLYSQWWFESQGAAGFLFLVGLWPGRKTLRREQWSVLAYAVSVTLLYVFYLPFDQWWYLRFLIPAIPIAMLFSSDAVAWVAGRSLTLRTAALSVLLIAGAAHAFRYVGTKDIMINAELERRRYLDAAAHLDTLLPRDAVILAMQHSGSVRYYTGRLTMRWDALDAAWLDRAVGFFQSRQIPAYALLESWEEDDFRRRFAGQRTVSLLEKPVVRSSDGELRLYRLDGPGPESPGIIPRSNPSCLHPSPRFIRPAAAERLVNLR